ncbi:unnamed protein product [Adineta steineri]|uniref:ER-bound oxygenase mpaB/mpaB'/Rubber oxygenase catalytic domain-containing protein n=1 Tax=Adineta steineri TaxID=433720 RepID=A0A814L750_9BILA|nr:unnamed protein product [Adineta steineri]
MIITLTILASVVSIYLSACRYFRFHHLKYILHKYKNVRLDYQKALEISRIQVLYDFPYTTELSVSFALFKTYGIPSISRLLAKTNQLAHIETAGRRAEDTSILLAECFLNDLDSSRAQMAIARINYLHSLYKNSISNDDMLYTLSLFILEPIQWAKKYEWRSLVPIEQEARFIYWKEMGERMGIKNIPLTLNDINKWSIDYEVKYMIYSKDNQICGEATLALFLSFYPDCMQKFARKVLISLIDERLRLSMGFEEVPHWIKQVTTRLLRIRAFLLRHCVLPRFYPTSRGQVTPSCPMTKDGRYQRTGYIFEPWYMKETWFNTMLPFIRKQPSSKYKSHGFRTEELGPEKFSGLDTQVSFRIDLASQHVNNRIEQENKNAWGSTFDLNKHMIGPQNLSGKSVFDISPLNGIISAGSKKQLTVIFSPDHDSDFFSDLVHITISEQPVKLEFRLRGSGRQNTMYIRPLDNANVIQKSLLPNISDAVTMQMQTIDPNEKGLPNNIVVILCAQMVNGKYVPAQRELMIGCAGITTGSKRNGEYTFDNLKDINTEGFNIDNPKSSVEMGCAGITTGSKRNGEYTFDNLKDINTEGFNIDNPKSSVEMGTEKAVKITWTPPSSFDINEACRATITVTTKGDISRTWRVILVGYVDSTSSADKRSSRVTKNRQTLAASTRSHASTVGTNQRLPIQQENTIDNNNTT